MSDPAINQTFAALGDPTRLAVVDLLRQRPHRAGELAQALGMSAPALSRHLRVLRRSGLIADDEPEHDARVRLYRLDAAAFASMRDWLDEVEAFWTQQLNAFREHAEQQAAAASVAPAAEAGATGPRAGTAPS